MLINMSTNKLRSLDFYNLFLLLFTWVYYLAGNETNCFNTYFSIAKIKQVNSVVIKIEIKTNKLFSVKIPITLIDR